MSEDLKAIKKRILKEDKLEQIYEAMGCDYIAVRNRRIEASLPPHFHSTNRRSVQTKFNDSLSSSVRNRGFSGDIFFLVSYIVNGIQTEKELYKDIPNSKRFICETLGWLEYLEGGDFQKRTDYLAPLKAIKKGRQRKREVKPNPVLPESILDQYLPYPSYDWIEEGISYNTQLLYGVGFDLDSHRIIIPMRNRFGQLIGVKGRILHDEDDDRKYMYLYQFNNSQELFNFHFAHPYILMEKKVFLVEGEKSCMKLHQAGIYNSVAIGSSDISDIQAEIIKQCGLDIEIVLCYDSDMFSKDVIKAIKEDPVNLPIEVKKAILLFTGRTTYVMIDMQGLLGPKMAPIDLGLEIFNKLKENNCYHIPPELVVEPTV